MSWLRRLLKAGLPFPLFAALAKGLTIRGYIAFDLTQDGELLARAKSFVCEGLESSALKPVFDRTFTFRDIAEAHRYMESNQQMGKIVVTVSILRSVTS